MASAESQNPTCPVCRQSDQVKTTQAAYESGVERCAPPDMPTKNVSMMKYILLGGVIVGICIFLIVVLIGGAEAALGEIFQLILVSLTLISIIFALVISYIAFQRVVRGDAEATERFPQWDRAMAKWRSLYYCQRDDVVFDPEEKKVVSDEQLSVLRSLDTNAPEVQSASLASK